MFGRCFAGRFAPAMAPEGKEKRVTLDAGEKWSDEREELERTDMRGFICCVYAIVRRIEIKRASETTTTAQRVNAKFAASNACLRRVCRRADGCKNSKSSGHGRGVHVHLARLSLPHTHNSFGRTDSPYIGSDTRICFSSEKRKSASAGCGSGFYKIGVLSKLSCCTFELQINS